MMSIVNLSGSLVKSEEEFKKFERDDFHDRRLKYFHWT